MQYIITYSPCFKKNALRELKSIDNQIRIITDFNESISLIETIFSQEDFQSKILKNNVIFIKHIAPVSVTGEITGDLEKDKQLLLHEILNHFTPVKNGEKFAIQTRICDGETSLNAPLDYSAKDIEVYIGTYFTDLGGMPTFSDKQIINDDEVNVFSIFIYGNRFYIGNSLSLFNLNFSCDDYRISSHRGKREISRAENKLTEALSKYKIDLGEKGGYALDIGAAPGG